jgi:hypothetical protein
MRERLSKGRNAQSIQKSTDEIRGPDAVLSQSEDLTNGKKE